MNARSALRTATAADHEAVDRIFSRFRLTEAAGYRAFMRATASAHLPVERALDAGGVARLLPDWPERRREALICSDLEALGDACPAASAGPDFHDDASLLAGAYVLEGSRLGGAVLRREIPPGLPQGFLGAPFHSAGWRLLMEILDRHLHDRHKLDRAILAARQVFTLFAAAGREQLEPVA